MLQGLSRSVKRSDGFVHRQIQLSVVVRVEPYAEGNSSLAVRLDRALCCRQEVLETFIQLHGHKDVRHFRTMNAAACETGPTAILHLYQFTVVRHGDRPPRAT